MQPMDDLIWKMFDTFHVDFPEEPVASMERFSPMRFYREKHVFRMGDFSNRIIELANVTELPTGSILHILDDVSFQEAYDYLHENYISGARTCRTIFKGRPQLSLLYFNTIDRKYIKKCEGFWLRAENRLRENVTLDWILKHLEADQAIQYLKERGMEICPITKTK